MRVGERGAWRPYVGLGLLYVVALVLVVVSDDTVAATSAVGLLAAVGALAVGGAVLSALALLRRHKSDAVTDGLTGLANRAGFRKSSDRSLGRTGRYSAALMIDLNGFKQVNDTFGHATGDLVLVEFARLLRRCVPASGLTARLGGDAFAVVLPDLGAPGEAYEVAGQIAASIAPVMIEGRLVTLACGIGVAVAAPGEVTYDEIVHRADVAMHRAKRLGPDTRWAAWQESFEQTPAPV